MCPIIRKILLFFLGVFCFFLGVVVVLFVFFVRVIDANHTDMIYRTEKAVTVIYDGGHVRSIIMSNEVKPWLKWVVQHMAGFIYHEAIIHNPKGDVLPDSIDDMLKGYIKEKLQ